MDRRPLYRIKSKSYRGILCDIGKYHIVVQRIDIISYLYTLNQYSKFMVLSMNPTSNYSLIF